MLLGQAVLVGNTNLPDLLALFFQNDIQAWSQRRQQRCGVWRHSQLKQLIDANIEQCLKRMTNVAPSKPQEVCIGHPSLLRCVVPQIAMSPLPLLCGANISC
jgi:hypothetical protein